MSCLPMAAWCRCYVGLSKSLPPRGCRTTVIIHVLICGVQTFLTLAPQQSRHRIGSKWICHYTRPFFHNDLGRSESPLFSSVVLLFFSGLRFGSSKFSRTLCSPSRIATARVAPTPAPQPGGAKKCSGTKKWITSIYKNEIKMKLKKWNFYKKMRKHVCKRTLVSYDLSSQI